MRQRIPTIRATQGGSGTRISQFFALCAVMRERSACRRKWRRPDLGAQFERVRLQAAGETPAREMAVATSVSSMRGFASTMADG
jgi:hypothetical protein